MKLMKTAGRFVAVATAALALSACTNNEEPAAETTGEAAITAPATEEAPAATAEVPAEGTGTTSGATMPEGTAPGAETQPQVAPTPAQ